MKKFYLMVALMGMVSLISTSVQADPKPWIFSWHQGYEADHDFKVNLASSRQAHNSQWSKSVWKPEDWIAQRGSDVEAVRAFYTADVFRDQYIEDDIPVLEVGSAFYHLSGQDRRRVLALVDHVYGVTDAHLNALFWIYDAETEKPIGMYTQYGLQML